MALWAKMSSIWVNRNMIWPLTSHRFGCKPFPQVLLIAQRTTSSIPPFLTAWFGLQIVSKLRGFCWKISFISLAFGKERFQVSFGNERWKWFAWDELSRFWLDYRVNSRRNSLPPQINTSVGKQFHTNSSLATVRSEILVLLKKKETCTMDFSVAKFSFQVIWIPVSQLVAQSTTESVLAVGCCWNTGCPMPSCCISSARAGLRQQQLQAASAETFPW